MAIATIALAVAIFGAATASAVGITNFEAGTCTVENCTYSTAPGSFYTQSAGHPNFGVTDFSVGVENEDQVNHLKVELPPGLNVNPQATPQCSVEDFKADACPESTRVGKSEVGTVVAGFEPPPLPFNVYNLTPKEGEPALFGFHVKIELPLVPVISEFIFLETSIDWGGDYHESFFINNIEPFPPLKRNRLTFNGRAGGNFITLPSECNANSTSFLELVAASGAKAGPQPTTPPTSTAGCENVPFAPTVTANAGSVTDSSSPVTIALNVPQQSGAEEVNTSTVKSANVTVPGVGLNPATAPGLKFCPDANFPLQGEGAVTCPAESQIGTVAVEAPELPAGALQGEVYLASQKSRDPQSGQEYRIFVNAQSTKYDVAVRTEGRVKANPVTGQLTAELDELPQVFFSSATLTFGPTPKHAIPVLSSPNLCSQSATSSATPYSTNQSRNLAPTQVSLSNAPGGGACAKKPGERPFTPAVIAKPASTKAGAYTPYELTITRPEGQQELKGFNLTLPPGAIAKIAGVPYCEAPEYNAAAGRSGTEELKTSSCKAASQIGNATILSGTGATPLKIEGKAYLSGPFQGAPLSIVVLTPAVAGPFDLGTVVVHAPLAINPETAVVSTNAQIPDVFGGAKLDIRQVSVNLNRKEFTLNGTNCNKGATTGSILGGGENPADPSAWSSAGVNVGFQATGCEGLDFSPNLKVQLYGQTRRAKHPRLTATLTTKEGQANVASASLALPKSIFLDQRSLGTVCTRPQFAANQCPARSKYGYARAWTPLLANPVEGSVYLRSSNNKLPDLVADLKGQVGVVLDGRIDSFKGGIRTTFGSVPDVPVSKFELRLPGGKHGLLQASKNLCEGPVKGIINLIGQNGKTANRHAKIQTPCKGRHPKKHKGKKGKKHAKKSKGKADGKHKGGGGKKHKGGKKK